MTKEEVLKNVYKNVLKCTGEHKNTKGPLNFVLEYGYILEKKKNNSLKRIEKCLQKTLIKNQKCHCKIIHKNFSKDLFYKNTRSYIFLIFRRYFQFMNIKLKSFMGSLDT